MNDEKFDLENFPTSEAGKRMLESVSAEFYAKSYVAKWLYQVMGMEWDEIRVKIDELPAQFFPETATWGLKYHEIMWHLPVREDLSYEERRQLIAAKETEKKPVTPAMMEEYVSNATGFNVVISDYHDPGPYGFVPEHPNQFAVYFVGYQPLDRDKAYKAIDQIKQSHTTYKMNHIEYEEKEIDWNLYFGVGICAQTEYHIENMDDIQRNISADVFFGTGMGYMPNTNIGNKEKVERGIKTYAHFGGVAIVQENMSIPNKEE